ncbi:MAG TPA: serine/threonine-protein kinase [Thermoanaerobaculia bacterium]|jgi:serine/threonine-protein kinase|nr:serine/threonine-protein kinase [Thermoanaerobaculia bacterium]
MADSSPTTQTFSSSEPLDATPLRLFSPGTQLANRYEIRRAIDSGGSAVVYEAHDRELHRDIALKVLRPDRVTDAALTRFRREVAIARDASSPRLVRIFDIQTSDGAIYLTMELVEGESLRRRLQDSQRLPIDEVIRIATSIAEGLDALHSLNIIHRDIKPGNVLLDTNGDVKLGDFGLARHLEDTTHATSTGAIVGTLAYLSPEQALGTGVDSRSDLYGLGVVMFEMLTGKLPFDAESALGALLARMKTSPSDVRQLRKDCPRWLAALVARLLERKPENRYPSARMVLSDLQHRRAAIVPRRIARFAFVGVALIAIAIAAAFAFRAWQHQNAFSHLTESAGNVNAVSRSGAVLWTLRGFDSETVMQYAVLEHGHGGEREIAVVLRPPRDLDMERNHTLSFLDPRTGIVKRRVRLPENAANNFRYLPRRYVLGSLRAVDLDDDDHEEVLATFIQFPEWPSYTTLYEPRIQRSRGVFAATGHFHAAGSADIDGDGAKDLIFQGIHNSYGWYNTVAAVKLQPRVNSFDLPIDGAGTPDVVEYGDRSNLLWFAYLPRALRMDPGITAHADSRNLVRVSFPNGRLFLFGTDGLPVDATNRAARATARMQAFASLRDADRLTAAGSNADAITHGNEAFRNARINGNVELMEAVQVRRGRYLVRASRVVEAEAHYEAISRGSSSGADIAMAAAEELHLHGDVERAVRWYRRTLSFARAEGHGRSVHEFIEGLVLALAELGRYDEGVAEVNRVIGVYGDADLPSFYREFLRWRSGARPDTSGLIPEPTIDVHRYWLLEFANANGTSPASLLQRFDPVDEAQAQGRSALLSLHAEILHRLGRTEEARATIERALGLAEIDQASNTIARGHLSLVRERHARIMGTN